MKAYYIVGAFMHLKHEKINLALVILVPMVFVLGLISGLLYEVDHEVPINSDLVCGLNCEANLQIILGQENQRKGNRWWPDMW